MLKIGFELELFCRTFEEDGGGGEYCLVPDGLPYDECGWLVEVRSEPHHDLDKAIALLEAELLIVARAAWKAGVVLVREPLIEIPRELRVAAARIHDKGRISYQNIYGHQTHRCSPRFATAALHISLTNSHCFQYFKPEYTKSAGTVQGSMFGWAKFNLPTPKIAMKEAEFGYPGFVDHALLIGFLDKYFKTEIRAARRNPGFYERKADGRIEYRSLPNNVDLEKVRDVIGSIYKELGG